VGGGEATPQSLEAGRMKIFGSWMILACAVLALACTDGEGVTGSGDDIIGEAVVVLDVGDGSVSIDPASMDLLTANGGDGRVRYVVKGPNGETLASVKANGFKEAGELLLKQAGSISERAFQIRKDAFGKLTSEEQEEAIMEIRRDLDLLKYDYASAYAIPSASPSVCVEDTQGDNVVPMHQTCAGALGVSAGWGLACTGGVSGMLLASANLPNPMTWVLWSAYAAGWTTAVSACAGAAAAAAFAMDSCTDSGDEEFSASSYEEALELYYEAIENEETLDSIHPDNYLPPDDEDDPGEESIP